MKVTEFIKLESAGGIALVLAAFTAVIIANTSLYASYDYVLHDIRLLDKSPLHWINDVLMAVFFFLVGLEIKREFAEGELSTRAQAMLPAIAAFGGMVVPTVIFWFINKETPENLSGWAIPAATDIAFALGVLSLLGSRVPVQLKILLTAIAVLDDLGAILIIGLFYSGDIFAHIYIEIALVLAALTPRRFLETLIHKIHPWVAFLILPVFAFANAGVPFTGMGLHSLFDPLTFGIIAGLFIGKQLGIFGTLYGAIKSGLCPMPKDTSWKQLYGMSILCGIGFTMSLFIAGLAFSGVGQQAEIRLGVLSGSILSAVIGYGIIRFSSRGQ